MTEMSAVTHLVPPFGDTRKPGSIGPAIAGVECRLVNPNTGEDVHPGEPGAVDAQPEGHAGLPEQPTGNRNDDRSTRVAAQR
jgi:acyl-CoA synthetase (AMP-forming)/AMP-acid ligase II